MKGAVLAAIDVAAERLTNARTVDPITGIATLDGNVRSQGIELGLVGRPLPEWNIFFGYTYLDTEVLESKEVMAGIRIQGKQLPNAPQNTATFWTISGNGSAGCSYAYAASEHSASSLPTVDSHTPTAGPHRLLQDSMAKAT